MDLTQHPLDRKFQAWAARYHRFSREPLTMGSVWMLLARWCHYSRMKKGHAS